MMIGLVGMLGLGTGAGSAQTYLINGRVATSTGAWVSGVTVTLSGGASRTITTTSDGIYAFTDLTGGSNYTVTPSKTGCTFTPGSFSATPLISNLNDRNLTANCGRLAFTVHPASVAVGAAISPAVVVEIQDANGVYLPNAPPTQVTLA
ncbi:MAG: carboxypeptidase regulatory-like domain-containing protein, partial [Bryobacteraceae bacterium]